MNRAVRREPLDSLPTMPLGLRAPSPRVRVALVLNPPLASNPAPMFG